ncbi:hypothetical protein HRbin27_00487 [bacterium HR27]|nr:hypothetical protein HRbin27_00487 [bacterium HR27]
MKGKRNDLDTPLAQFAEQTLGEMESGGRGSDRAGMRRIDRLVSFRVMQGFPNVGRKRNMTVRLEPISDDRLEFDDDLAPGTPLENAGRSRISRCARARKDSDDFPRV